VPQESEWPETDDDETDGSSASSTEPTAGDNDDAEGDAESDEPTAVTDAVDPTAGEDSTNTTETTTTLGAVTASDDEQPTQTDLPAVGAEEAPRRRRGLRRSAIVAGVAVAALALLYGIDVLINHGDVPRDVTVAGVDIGGMSPDDARDVLHEELEPRVTQPVELVAGDVETTISPEKAGLALDWDATLETAGEQSYNPITRLTSFFTTREIGVVTSTEQDTLDDRITELADEVNRDTVEGDIEFDGAEPVAIQPQHGQKLKTEAATELILNQWVTDHPLQLPMSTESAHVTRQAVSTAMDKIAEPAVSGPVTVHGEGTDDSLEPKGIAGALSFHPTDEGKLEPKITSKKVAEGVELESTEKTGKSAEIVFQGGEPTVEPAESGKQINWKKTTEPLLETLTGNGPREIDAVYEKDEPDLTTQEAKDLGINEVIGKFTTSDFAPDSGVNIKKVAQEVNGAIVKPGETFSLNGYTGQRTKAQGYVSAGIIQNGVPAEGVGGGISQFATTLYNASYFAGMKDAGHQEHSYYIDRYPEAREATVFMRPDGTSVIDVKFTNNYDTGVAIQTEWTPSSITVKLWGTKHVEVESVTGERHDYTSPGVRHVTDAQCIPTAGQQGFTSSDTRIIRDADSNEVISKDRNTVVYDSVPKVICEDADSDDDKGDNKNKDDSSDE